MQHIKKSYFSPDHQNNCQDDECCCDNKHRDNVKCGHNHGKIGADRVKFQATILLISLTLLACTFLFSTSPIVEFLLFFLSYCIISNDVILTAVKNIFRGKIFDENFLMTVATMGAFFIGDYMEAIAVMMFYCVGELLSDIAVSKSKKSIASLMDIKPETAKILRHREITECLPEDVLINDIVIVRAGDKIPIDGIISKGTASIDNSTITGEFDPVLAKEGDPILSGGICTDGVLEIKTTQTYKNSTVAKIINLTYEASEKKADTEKFITRFAQKYTPVVVLLALITATLPPLLGFGSFEIWIYRALSFLVVSCPCALVLSVPLGYFAGIGKASKKGILVKGGQFLELFHKVQTIVLDKTGTITKGKPVVCDVILIGDMQKDEILSYASALECHSNHPTAVAITDAFNDQELRAKNIREISGKGISAVIGSRKVLCGNYKLLQEYNIDFREEQKDLGVFVCIDDELQAIISVEDQIRPESKTLISKLRCLGIKNIIMLTGDNYKSAQKIAKEVNISQFKADLLPQDKLLSLESIIKTQQPDQKLCFVGDGINDAPSIKRADVGIAMGAFGTDVAIECADIVIMANNLERLCDLREISVKTVRIARQNIIFAICVKILFMILVFFGISSMWFAVFADVGVTIIAVINCLRILK